VEEAASFTRKNVFSELFAAHSPPFQGGVSAQADGVVKKDAKHPYLMLAERTSLK
jgi:hypothetical protein